MRVRFQTYQNFGDDSSTTTSSSGSSSSGGSFWKSLFYPIFGDVPQGSVPCSGTASGKTDANGNAVDNCGNVVGQPLPAGAPTELTTYYDPTSGTTYQATAPLDQGGFQFPSFFPSWAPTALAIGAVVLGVGAVTWVGYKVVKKIRRVNAVLS